MTHERQIEQLQASLIAATLRAAAVAEGVNESAIEDILLHDRSFTVADDGRTVLSRDGATPRDWVKTMRASKAHWFNTTAEDSKKAGDSVENPWSAAHWNKTNQGKIYSEDPTKAEAMAKAAGVDVFARSPKTQQAA